MSLSSRTRWPQSPNLLTLAVERRRARGERILDLTLGNPTTAGFETPDDLLAPLAHPRGLRYAPDPLGLQPARQAVAERYAAQGSPVPAERVVITASTSEAYSHLFHVLADVGDEVLTPAPSYPLFGFLADLAGVKLVPYPLRYDGNWHIDLDALQASIGPRTRAVLLVSPNNPTGSYLKRSELDALTSLCAEHDLALVSDEVFAPYPLREDASRVTTLVMEQRCLCFSLSGLSKISALPQLKLGWLIASGPDALVAQALERIELVSDTFLSVATPVQLALPDLLASGDKLASQLRARTAENLATLRAALAQPSAATLLDLEGGWYATVRLPATRGEEDWALALLDRGVLVHPGHFFDFAQEAFMVLSLLPEPSTFAEGVRQLTALVDEP